MTAKIDLSNCRYCSEVSLAQGEDPIGTAGVAKEWLIIEVPRPWKKDIWSEKLPYKPIIGVLMELERQQPNPSLRLMAIAQDKEYSVKDRVRVFYYYRPQKMFANYAKMEYLVPLVELINLVKAILLEPKKLTNFDLYKENTNLIRDILVCTHTQYDTACGRYGTPLYEKLRKHYANDKLRIWHTSHFGGHKFAPTLIDFPSGRFWGHLKPELLDSLVYERGDIRELEQCYRGWSGLERFAQIAEREVWLFEGWQWFDYSKSGKVIDSDRGNIFEIGLKSILELIPLQKAKLLKQKLDSSSKWVEVLIEYIDPHNESKQAYQVRVELKTKITTAAKSNKPMQFQSVNQYYVSKCQKVVDRETLKKNQV